MKPQTNLRPFFRTGFGRHGGPTTFEGSPDLLMVAQVTGPFGRARRNMMVLGRGPGKGKENGPVPLAWAGGSEVGLQRFQFSEVQVMRPLPWAAFN